MDNNLFRKQSSVSLETQAYQDFTLDFLNPTYRVGKEDSYLLHRAVWA